MRLSQQSSAVHYLKLKQLVMSTSTYLVGAGAQAPSQQLTGTGSAVIWTGPESKMGTQHEQEWDMVSKFLPVQTPDHSKADERVDTLLQTMSNT